MLFRKPSSVRAYIIRSSIFLYLTMLAISSGVLVISLELEEITDLNSDMTAAARRVDQILSDPHFRSSGSSAPELHNHLENKELLPALSYNYNDIIIYICIDKSPNNGQEFEEYLYIPVRDDEKYCRNMQLDKAKQTLGVGEQIISRIVEMFWNPKPQDTIEEYNYCEYSDDNECVEVVNVKEINSPDNTYRTRVLKTELRDSLIMNLTSMFSDENHPGYKNRMARITTFIAIIGAATMIFVTFVAVIVHKLGKFGRQAKHLQDYLINREIDMLDEQEYIGELADIASAAKKQVTTFKKSREYLMKCAVELGQGMSHNENKILSNLGIVIDTISGVVEKRRNVSAEQLEAVAVATRGVRASLEGIGRQLIRWSIEDFSGMSDTVNVSETLSDAITAVKIVPSAKDLVWHEDIPELNAKTVQFCLLTIIVNILNNAKKHARKNIQVSVRNIGEEIEIVVEDDGPGFPPRKQERELLLEWGHRAGLYVGSNSGVGIGLALAAEWLRNGGGDIELSSSSEWGGACVTIRVQCK